MFQTPARARTRPLLRTALCLLLSALLGGCATWRVADSDPQIALADVRPEKVRVTTSDGAQTVLRQPRILGNVLAGLEDGCVARFGTDTDDCQETGIAIFEIERLEVQERRAIGQVALAAVALGALWLLVNR